MRTNNETHIWALALVTTISPGCVSTPKATEEKPDSALVLSVEGNFEKYCSKCHGLDGKGDTPFGQRLGAKDYTSAEVQAKLKDDAASRAIRQGVKDGDRTVMRGYEGDLSDDDINALVAYMRSFKK